METVCHTICEGGYIIYILYDQSFAHMYRYQSVNDQIGTRLEREKKKRI